MTEEPKMTDLSAKLDARPATFTCDKSKVGPLYYFAITDRAPGPYKTQRHVEAILDIASDGTLAGVELIDNMPPPPALAQSIRTTEAGEVEKIEEIARKFAKRWGVEYVSDPDKIAVFSRTDAVEKVDAFFKYLSQPPAEGVKVTDVMVADAMQDAWNEICSDTGCHPLDIERKGRSLFFQPNHWARFIAARLRSALEHQP